MTRIEENSVLWNLFLDLNRKIGDLAEIIETAPDVIAKLDSLQQVMDQLQLVLEKKDTP